MTIKQFVEKAIEGGYRGKYIYLYAQHNKDSNLDIWRFSNEYNKVHLLLDPLAWQAVGKVEGWGAHKMQPFTPYNKNHIDRNITEVCYICDIYGNGTEITSICTGWQHNMHTMIDALIDGKSIEQYLDTL